MAAAAAIAIARHRLHARHQLILVTFTRSAAANLKAKIRQHLRHLGAPQNGFAVFTLHGLALHIATRHPDLSGINLDTMTLATLNQSHRLVRACVEQWIALHPKLYQRLLEGRQFDGEETERLRRQSVLRTEVLPTLAHTVIHEAKSSGLSPDELRSLSSMQTTTSIPQEYADFDPMDLPEPEDYSVLEIAAGLYERYQDLLNTRGLIDYDDMILAALRVLQDEQAQQLWQEQVFAIFEDEAQDSSPLQTQLLEILAIDPASQRLNLVRVGDPNQAINSTFTPADPVYFNQFCQRCEQQDCLATIEQAGRSSPIIMNAANFMLDWVNQQYRQQMELPFRPQTIRPVAKGDPQADANPSPFGSGLELHRPPDIYQTIEMIGQRVVELFTQYPDSRAAILVRENKQGTFLANLLRHPDSKQLNFDLSDCNVQVYDVGERDRTSNIPSEVLSLLQFIERPHSPDYLKGALTVLMQRQLIPSQDLNLAASQPEEFLYPSPLSPIASTDPIVQARRYCCGLLRARLELPPSQLIPFIGLTLDYEQSDLATLNKLAARIAQQTMSDSSLSAILQVLTDIVTSERFEPVETEDLESRYTRPGQLTIITMHKAKGLDWDFVFLPFLHKRQIPGDSWIPPQMQFLGDFTLAEVARAQLRAYVHQETSLPNLPAAWQRAGQLKTAEEFRLLYVAMTRARRLLWMSAARQAPFTWNKPDNLQDAEPCPVLRPLYYQFCKDR
jgi:DNA helicase-2/ATP-dependent DNA helicase PcrA